MSSSSVVELRSSSSFLTADWSEVGGSIESQLASCEFHFNSGGVDYTVCRCKLHVAVEHGVRGAWGCAARKHGTLPVITALYDSKKKNGFCHATPDTREADAALVKEALDFGQERAAYARAGDVSGFASGAVVAASAWGAMFCYMDTLVADGRWRSARVLGPEAWVVDLLAILRVAGRYKMPAMAVQRRGSLLHVVREQGMSGQMSWAGVAFVKVLLSYVRDYGFGLRIGGEGEPGSVPGGLSPLVTGLPGAGGFLLTASGERAGTVGAFSGVGTFGAKGLEVAAWLRERVDVILPDVARWDLGLAVTTAGSMPVGAPGAKDRHKRLSLLGDRVCKMVLAVCAVDSDLTVEKLSIMESKEQSDATFCGRALAGGLLDLVVAGAAVDPASARVGGSAFEAVAGVVFLYGGLVSVRKFLVRLGVVLPAV